MESFANHRNKDENDEEKEERKMKREREKKPTHTNTNACPSDKMTCEAFRVQRDKRHYVDAHMSRINCDHFPRDRYNNNNNKSTSKSSLSFCCVDRSGLMTKAWPKIAK